MISLAHITCTFGPVVILISNAKSTFSFASMFIGLAMSCTVRNATARFLKFGDAAVDGFRSFDARRFGETVFDFIDCCRVGVADTLLSVSGTFDILLMPSFLLRFCALSKHFC